VGTGRFLWSFFVDDTPEVLVFTLVIVGSAYGLRNERDIAVVVLPLIAVVGLVFGVWRACRRSEGVSQADHQPRPGASIHDEGSVT